MPEVNDYKGIGNQKAWVLIIFLLPTSCVKSISPAALLSVKWRRGAKWSLKWGLQTSGLRPHPACTLILLRPTWCSKMNFNYFPNREISPQNWDFQLLKENWKFWATMGPSFLPSTCPWVEYCLFLWKGPQALICDSSSPSYPPACSSTDASAWHREMGERSTLAPRPFQY